jgi:glycine/D-amino acid oxidase-like deaminating enzyme
VLQAGLTVALGLSEAGKSVIVVEAAGIGEAASGLNAGMAINGYSREGSDLVDDVGLEVCRTKHASPSQLLAIPRRRRRRGTLARR